MRYYSLFFLTLLSLACSSVNYKKIDDSDSLICDGNKPVQKWVFNLASYNDIPSGMKIEDVASYADHQDNSNTFIIEHFLQLLMSTYFDQGLLDSKGNPSIQQNEELIEGDSKFLGKGSAPSRIFNKIYWMDQNNFILCGGKNCDQAHFIKKSNRGDGTYVYGGKHGLLDYVLDSGFNLGRFIGYHYFVVPERERTALCEKAGFQADCFDIKDAEEITKYRKLLAYTPEVRQKFPFTSRSCLMGSSNQSILDDTPCKQRWQSAYTLDLLVQTSVKVSKKLDKSWVINQVEWDPTLFCKYARSITELRTR